MNNKPTDMEKSLWKRFIRMHFLFEKLANNALELHEKLESCENVGDNNKAKHIQKEIMSIEIQMMSLVPLYTSLQNSLVNFNPKFQSN